jgi:hypothetical protein
MRRTCREDSMRRIVTTGLLTASALLAASAPAHADEVAATPRDGYCDYTKGVADAEAALLFSPELFGSFGYVDQAVDVTAPDATSNDLRLTAGVKFSLGNVWEGILVRKRAKADCRRHQALDDITGGTTYRALEARANVLAEALIEAEKLLAQANQDLDSRRATAQEVGATKLRVDELRDLAADTQIALDELPPPVAGRTVARALAVYYKADVEVEEHEASLRSAAAWDVSVRVGFDTFLGADDESPYIALVSANFNLGWLLQRGANKRAAAGRKLLVTKEHGGQRIDSTVSRLVSMLEIEQKRKTEVGVLLADLDEQLDQLKSLGGDAGRRYRQTVWFEWVKVKAEHAYLTSHVASLQEILGAEPEQ